MYKGVEIEMPFDRWSIDGIRAGRKRCTSRSEARGVLGDYFIVDGRRYYLIDVTARRLSQVASDYYRLEGAGSTDDFKNVWKRIYGRRHPGYQWQPDRIVYTHVFYPLSEMSQGIGKALNIQLPEGDPDEGPLSRRKQEALDDAEN